MSCTSSGQRTTSAFPIFGTQRQRPNGIYWGHVGEDTFHEVTRYFVPPDPEEGFRMAHYAFPPL